jgi:polyhydroxybutyrate depolymerase
MPERLPLHSSPSRSISVLIINNVDDPMAPWKGGDFRFGRLRLGKGLSVSDAVDYWVTHNKCSSTPVVTHEPDEDSQDGTKVGKTSKDINANEVIWNFFKTHSIE